MAGLTCGTTLSRHGIHPIIYDKGRGAGGRMAARRVEVEGSLLHFDHGAQYFTARDPAFKTIVDNWLRDGVIARWPAAGTEAYVGTPAMETIGRSKAHPGRRLSLTSL